MESVNYEQQHGDKIAELLKETTISGLSVKQCQAVFTSLRELSKAIQTGANFADYNESEAMEGFRKSLSEMMGKPYRFDLTDKYRLDTDLLELEKDIEIIQRNNEQNREAVRQYLKENPPPAEFVAKYSEWVNEYLQ